MIPIITIEGPTGSGKSVFAIELAKYLNTEIISADSRQVYRYMDIGTAKVGKEDLGLVRHHLIDVINPDQSYNAGSFAADAERVIKQLHAKNMVPIICGGTGLYIQSLIRGLCKLPEIADSVRTDLKERLRNEGLDSLYRELCDIDAALSAKLSPNDSQRILRGLEVYYATGKPLSCHWNEQNETQKYSTFRILINTERDTLYKRINLRLTQMLKMGLIDEIRSLLEMGYNKSSPGLNSLGYKEFIPYLEGAAKLQDCADVASQHHRNYAKRQATWYRKCSFNLSLTGSSVNISNIAKIIMTDRTEERYANNG